MSLNAEDFKLVDAGKTSHSDIKMTEAKMRMISHQIKQDVRHDAYIARSCCGFKVDMRWARMLTQIFVILFAITFLIAKMWTSEGCEEQQTWIGLFTFIVGLIFPTPFQVGGGGGGGVVDAHSTDSHA